MGHHKAAGHSKYEKKFKVGKDNASPPPTTEVATEPVLTRSQALQQRLQDLTEAGSGAYGDLRTGLGTVSQDVRASLGAAYTQLKKSVLKAAGRFDGVLQFQTRKSTAQTSKIIH